MQKLAPALAFVPHLWQKLGPSLPVVSWRFLALAGFRSRVCWLLGLRLTDGGYLPDGTFLRLLYFDSDKAKELFRAEVLRSGEMIRKGQVRPVPGGSFIDQFNSLAA